MTILATLVISHSDDEAIKAGETYHLVLQPEQLVAADAVPPGVETAQPAQSAGEAPAVGTAEAAPPAQ